MYSHTYEYATFVLFFSLSVSLSRFAGIRLPASTVLPLEQWEEKIEGRGKIFALPLLRLRTTVKHTVASVTP